MPRSFAPVVTCLLVILMAASRTLAAAPATAPTTAPAWTSPWQPTEYPISYWCGPPPQYTSLERYQQVKDAGFTFVMPPCHGMTPEENLKILDICQKVGLKAILQDRRLPRSYKGEPEVRAKLDAVIKDYAKHPALAGYIICDEPIASQFEGIFGVINYLKEHDPKHVALVNLFPNVVAPNLLRAKSYDDYVRRYARGARPFTLSYDHYSMQTKGDDRLFIANLAAVRKVAVDEHLPFWNIVQVTQFSHMRNLTPGELEYEAMQTLAMGAKGLIWFTYWTPVNDKSQPWAHAMIGPDGKPNPHYDMVRDVNTRLVAFGNELLHATTTAYFQTGTIPPGGKSRPADAPVSFDQTPPPLTVGLFDAPAGGKRLVMFASGDYKQPVKFTAAIGTGGQVERFDSKARTWSAVESRSTIELPPGGAALFRLGGK